MVRRIESQSCPYNMNQVLPFMYYSYTCCWL